MVDPTMEELYMSRAIHLAQKGCKHVKSNPKVGCVIVHNNVILGEGYHEKYGQNHAEANAIQNVKENGYAHLLSESTMYVTLEPCNHVGKTPPCAQAILKHKIPKLIVGHEDPTKKLRGKSLAFLKNQGVAVNLINHKECKNLIRPFTVMNNHNRPYVIIKFAQSSDRFIGKINEKTSISNQSTNTLVHKWRTEIDALLVGTKTILVDNPQLTARHYPGDSPLRITFDYEEKLDKTFHIISDNYETLIVSKNPTDYSSNVRHLLVERGEDEIENLLKTLYKMGIYLLMVEGGTNTMQKFINKGLWDEARIITSSKPIGSGVKAPQVRGKLNKRDHILNDTIDYIFKD